MESMCRNQLLVSGPSQELERFAVDARAGDAPLSFASLRPVPMDPEEEAPLDPLIHKAMQLFPSLSRQGADEGWKLANWSTFCEAQGPRVSRDVDGSLRYDFYSSPPIALIRWLSQSRPSLRFDLSWYDINARYSGRLRVSNGRDVLREASSTATMLEPLAGSSLDGELREHFDDLDLWDDIEMETSERQAR